VSFIAAVELGKRPNAREIVNVVSLSRYQSAGMIEATVGMLSYARADCG
jgi:hypothetical protein